MASRSPRPTAIPTALDLARAERAAGADGARARPGGVSTRPLVGGAAGRRTSDASTSWCPTRRMWTPVEWELLDPVVRDHEPHGALVAGPGSDYTPGFADIEAILVGAAGWLGRPGARCSRSRRPRPTPRSGRPPRRGAAGTGSSPTSLTGRGRSWRTVGELGGTARAGRHGRSRPRCSRRCGTAWWSGSRPTRSTGSRRDWSRAPWTGCFAAKGRPPDLALPVLDRSPGQRRPGGVLVSRRRRSLWQRRFWPGPLTLVVRAKRAVGKLVGGHGRTVGLRWPDYPLVEQLCLEVGPWRSRVPIDMGSPPSRPPTRSVWPSRPKRWRRWSTGVAARARRRAVVDCTATAPRPVSARARCLGPPSSGAPLRAAASRGGATQYRDGATTQPGDPRCLGPREGNRLLRGARLAGQQGARRRVLPGRLMVVALWDRGRLAADSTRRRRWRLGRGHSRVQREEPRGGRRGHRRGSGGRGGRGARPRGDLLGWLLGDLHRPRGPSVGGGPQPGLEDRPGWGCPPRRLTVSRRVRRSRPDRGCRTSPDCSAWSARRAPRGR